MILCFVEGSFEGIIDPEIQGSRPTWLAPLPSIHPEVAALGWPCHQPDHRGEAVRLFCNCLQRNVLSNRSEPNSVGG